jgi:hypothetical protein
VLVFVHPRNSGRQGIRTQGCKPTLRTNS